MPAPVPIKSRAKTVDEYVEIRHKMRAWKPDVNPHAQRFSELTAEILSWAAKESPEKRLVYEGTDCLIPVSPCENKRTISKPLELYNQIKKLGVARIIEFYRITLGNAEKALGQDAANKYISSARTGSREIGEPARKQIEQVAA